MNERASTPPPRAACAAKQSPLGAVDEASGPHPMKAAVRSGLGGTERLPLWSRGGRTPDEGGFGRLDALSEACVEPCLEQGLLRANHVTRRAGQGRKGAPGSRCATGQLALSG
jgi:hypothetical protein